MGIMRRRWRFRASSSLAPHPQRHITPNATEEIKLDGYRAVWNSKFSGVYSGGMGRFVLSFYPQGMQSRKAVLAIMEPTELD